MCKITIFTWSCGCPTLEDEDIAQCEAFKFYLNANLDGAEKEWMPSHLVGYCLPTHEIKPKQQFCELCRDGKNTEDNIKEREADKMKRLDEYMKADELMRAKAGEILKKLQLDMDRDFMTKPQKLKEIFKKVVQALRLAKKDATG